MFSFPVPSHFPAEIHALVRKDPDTLDGAKAQLHAEVRFWTYVSKTFFLSGFDDAIYAEIDSISEKSDWAYAAV